MILLIRIILHMVTTSTRCADSRETAFCHTDQSNYPLALAGLFAVQFSTTHH